MTNNPRVPTNLIPTKITQLPLADTPKATDSTIIVQDGITKRGTFGQFLEHIGPTGPTGGFGPTGPQGVAGPTGPT